MLSTVTATRPPTFAMSSACMTFLPSFLKSISMVLYSSLAYLSLICSRCCKIVGREIKGYTLSCMSVSSLSSDVNFHGFRFFLCLDSSLTCLLWGKIVDREVKGYNLTGVLPEEFGNLSSLFLL